MLKLPVQYPDDPSWREQPQYSPKVAHALTEAYIHLRRGAKSLEAYSFAYNIVVPVSRMRMSLRQRLHVVFILAMSYASIDEYAQARGCLDEALELTLRLDDDRARFEILYLRGSIQRISLFLREAASDFTECLSQVYTEQEGHGLFSPSETSLTIDTLFQLAFTEFFLGTYDHSLTHVQQASQLIPESDEATQSEAMLLWIRALHARLRGDPRTALLHARRAADICEVFANQQSIGRICSVVADSALDLCEYSGSLTGREFDDNISVAIRYVSHSLESVQSVSDYPGVGFARLTQARMARIAGSKVHPSLDTQQSIESVIKIAQNLSDSALLCQAYVGLGDSFAAKREYESSANSYRAAMSLAETTNLTALGEPARQALLHPRETPRLE